MLWAGTGCSAPGGRIGPSPVPEADRGARCHVCPESRQCGGGAAPAGHSRPTATSAPPAYGEEVPQLPRTDLVVSDLCLGANVFGWTADEPTSHALLDRFVDAVPSTQRPMVDTAEMYGRTVSSEEVLGSWLARRGNRDAVVVATKASPAKGKEHPLSAVEIRKSAEQSLRRLQTDRIDLYYAHYDDDTTPLEETLRALDELVQAGKVRYLAASNYSAPRLAEAMDTAKRLGAAPYVALQPLYNLMDRAVYEDDLRDAVAASDLACFPYFGLAAGFLTGKYRAGQRVDSVREKMVAPYIGERGDRVLAALRQVADARGVAPAAVALRWLADRPTVTAPIASGRSVEQLADLLPMLDLVLTDDERALLTDASA